jgi:hypothetical protein
VDPIKVSYSQLNTFRDCPLKFRWHYIDGYRVTEAAHKLQLGSAWHERVLEPHYRTLLAHQTAAPNGRSPHRGSTAETQWLVHARAAVETALAEALLSDTYTALTAEDYETLRWMYAGYTQHHGCDPAWRILDVEYNGLAPLGTITTPDGPRDVVLDYRIDLVVEDFERGGVFLVESKSTAQLTSKFAMELDDQTGLYEWAFLASDHPLAGEVNGTIRSETKKTMNAGDKPGATRGKAQTLDQRFQRLTVPRSPRELAALAADALAATQAAYGGNLPVYSAPNPSECGWKCQFKEVHVLARKGGTPLPILMRDFGFAQVPTPFNGLEAV